jgi:hypothetical protein
MSDKTIYVGDSKPRVRYQFVDENGATIDMSSILTSAAFHARYRGDSADAFSTRNMTAVTDGSDGLFEFAWQTTDLTKTGFLDFWAVLTFTDTGVETVLFDTWEVLDPALRPR